MSNRELHRVFVGVGTNLGRRLNYLNIAVARLQELSAAPIRSSAVYETEPVGVVEQPRFLNMVVELQVPDSPLALLRQLRSIEDDSGRKRTTRFGPRTLDLDVLLYDNRYVCFKNLQIPHPRMWERAFVMVPLSDLIPDRKALGGETVDHLAKTFLQGGDVRYVGRFW